MKILDTYIDGVKPNTQDEDGIIDIFWVNDEGEFGHIYLYFYPDEKIKIDSEHMNIKFVKQVLEKLADDAILLD